MFGTIATTLQGSDMKQPLYYTCNQASIAAACQFHSQRLRMTSRT